MKDWRNDDMKECRNVGMEAWMAGWLFRWMDGWMDEAMNECYELMEWDGMEWKERK